MKNGRLSATRLFSYSRFTVFEGRDTYVIDDAVPLEVFFSLRNDIGRLSLAQYFCELAAALAPQDGEAGDFLRLMLNALYLLGKGSRPNEIVKAAVEMRMLSLAGYQPDLVGCAECGRYEADVMHFLPRSGLIFCGECYRPTGNEPEVPLTPGVLTGLRHTIYADFEKLFSFSMSQDGRKRLADASETYVKETLGRSFQTLEFYHNLENTKPAG